MLRKRIYQEDKFSITSFPSGPWDHQGFSGHRESLKKDYFLFKSYCISQLLLMRPFLVQVFVLKIMSMVTLSCQACCLLLALISQFSKILSLPSGKCDCACLSHFPRHFTPCQDFTAKLHHYHYRPWQTE